jgi:transposase
VCAAPQDLRRSFDGLAAAAQQLVGEDPRSGGSMFVFVNKRRNRARVLWWEKNGYCLLYKRLHQALFQLPDAGDARTVRIDARALGALLQGIAASDAAHARAA